MSDATDSIFNDIDETTMDPMQQFKPSKLLGEVRIALNKSESKYFVVGHEPYVQVTNTFELTSSEVQFRTKARIVDRKTNLYIDLEYADICQLKDALSSIIAPDQQQQQPQQPRTYKFPIYLESVQLAKIMQDLFCISSRCSSETMLIGRVTLEQLVIMANQLRDLYKITDSISADLTRQANKVMMNILERAGSHSFESIEDICSKVEEMGLEPCMLHTELFLKYPEIYLSIFNDIKKF